MKTGLLLINVACFVICSGLFALVLQTITGADFLLLCQGAAILILPMSAGYTTGSTLQKMKEKENEK
jgi:hypothetical protein